MVRWDGNGHLSLLMLIDAHKAYYWSLQYIFFILLLPFDIVIIRRRIIQYRYYAQFTEIHTTEQNEASFATLQGSHCHTRQQHCHGRR